jgi:hypothetical protein
MSCPYFYPVQPLGGEADTRTPLLPLGNLWSGMCRAVPNQTRAPEESVLRRVCQLGYARGHCLRFPADDSGADAVRFTLSRHEADSLHLYYVLERDHHPFSHGPLEYSLVTRRLVQAPASEILARQAEAYAESYLRRKSARAVWKLGREND